MIENDSIDFSIDNENLEDLVDNITSKYSQKTISELDNSNEIKFGKNNINFSK